MFIKVSDLVISNMRPVCHLATLSETATGNKFERCTYTLGSNLPFSTQPVKGRSANDYFSLLRRAAHTDPTRRTLYQHASAKRPSLGMRRHLL